MTRHPVRWQAPQPLWTRFGANGNAAALSPEQARPAILRFATDDFMEQMLGTLARDPARIDALIAQPETWRVPGGAADDLIERTPLPRLAQSALRARAAQQVRPRVAPVLNTEAQPLKLYQPAHQRHYLVSASLVCALPGLPERAVAGGGGEPLNYVMRRLLKAPGAAKTDPYQEYAYITDGAGTRWQRVGLGDDATRAVAGEDPLPLFPLSHRDDTGRTRTLWTGSVPVGRREEYLGTKVDRSVAGPWADGLQQAVTPGGSVPVSTHKLARVTQFQIEVAEPLKALIRSAFKVGDGLRESITVKDPPDQAPGNAKRILDFNLQQQQLSWLVLLDLADYFETHLPALAQVIADDGAGASALTSELRTIHDEFLTASMAPDLVAGLQPAIASKPAAATVRAALKAMLASGVRDRLEATPLHYENGTTADAAWPSFSFVLAGLGASTKKPVGPFEALDTLDTADPTLVPADLDPVPSGATLSQQALEAARKAAEKVDRLTSLVGRALSDEGDAKAPPLPYALQLKNALNGTANDAGLFCIRFVYTRRDCGPLHPPLVSAPSERFQLASFFDADAPARPIRITLPTDTSPAGLRKFNKNTAFVLSDMLCGQVQRAKGLGLVDLVRSVLPWPLHKDLDVPAGSCKSGGVDIGMICSLSIPIITICALILLIIIVTLLDFIFRWLPYFVICFPVPGLKGKKE